LAVTGAQAADLPIAEPVEYVRICDTYGTGFFYIPGTETCLRIGGRVRAELRYLEPVLPSNRGENHTFTRVRTYLRADARTQTEYGLLRTFYDMWWTINSGGGVGTTMWSGFVQFGGFTAGRSGSFFDYFADVAGHWGSPLDGAYSLNRTNLFAYTFALGNGISFTVSAEDATFVRSTINGVAAYGGHVMPDFVAAARIDQGWGSAQLAAAVHQIRPTTATTQDSQYGWAVMAGVQINLPMIAAGDYVVFSGAYADGAVNYTGVANGAWLVPAANVMDAFTTATALSTAQAWSLQGSFVHNWSPQFYTGLTATYLDFNNPALAAGIADWSAWNILMVNAWTPVAGLVIGVEVSYENVDVSGAPGCNAVLLVGTAACDYDRWAGVFRVQRTW
ncbi:MAG: porin, partial [Hyphomicrobiales bacterium]|nr:porin [Hyphomicrobiales bacterium]